MHMMHAPAPGNPLISWSNFRWKRATGIFGVHAIATLILTDLLFAWPFGGELFTWWGLGIMVLGFYVFGTLGINLCYHRLLTHASFSTYKWFEYALTTLGVCNLQAGPVRWVAQHRMHHKESDSDDDIHSPHRPVRDFLWAHVGWILFNHPETQDGGYYKYAVDLARDKFHHWINRNWIWIFLAHIGLFYVIGYLLGLVVYPENPWIIMWSVVIYGVFGRLVIIWHITWSVNSAAHFWGRQMFDTGDESRNNWWVALLSNGEGWHNNHHRFPKSAAHGMTRSQFDVTYITIRVLEKLGLVWNVYVPPREQIDKMAKQKQDAEAAAVNEPPATA